jgi:hypothetical protein
MNVLRNRLGFALRESGQALERLGCAWQGINSHAEESRPPELSSWRAGPFNMQHNTKSIRILRSYTVAASRERWLQAAPGGQHYLDCTISPGVW